jgi:glycosyltransferase involved in cell wall biosynthesis
MAEPLDARRSVLFVATLGLGSMDSFSRQLAAHLAVDVLETDLHHRSAEPFGVPPVSCSSLRALAADLGFVRLLRRRGRVVHFANHHFARYGAFLSVPYLVTVHDLIRHFDATGNTRFIHAHNRRDRMGIRLDAAGIRGATAIVALSQSTKEDLVTHLGIPADRIFVVHAGLDHIRFRPVTRRLVEPPYVLFVGTEHPRKNLATLFEAFAALRRDPRFRTLRLVKVGGAGGAEAPFREVTHTAMRDLGIARDVVFTGRVPADDLPAYYSGASCLVLPSLAEGFGNPPLEAMACGCPAVVSTVGSLPEIAGDAALVVPPRDPEAIRGAMEALLVDPARRRELRARGLARAREFSWRRAARETLRVYQAVLG